MEDKSAKQTGGSSPPVRRSPVVANGTKALEASRSGRSRSGVSGTNSIVFVLSQFSLSLYIWGNALKRGVHRSRVPPSSLSPYNGERPIRISPDPTFPHTIRRLLCAPIFRAFPLSSPPYPFPSQMARYPRRSPSRIPILSCAPFCLTEYPSKSRPLIYDEKCHCVPAVSTS